MNELSERLIATYRTLQTELASRHTEADELNKRYQEACAGVAEASAAVSSISDLLRALMKGRFIGQHWIDRVKMILEEYDDREVDF